MTSIIMDSIPEPISPGITTPAAAFPHDVYNFLRYFCNYDVHEPLRLITGLTNVLQKTKLTGTQQDYVATMQHTAQEIINILETVRTLSDIEHGLINLRDYAATAVDMRPILMQGIALTYTGTELENAHREKASTFQAPVASTASTCAPTEVCVDMPAPLPLVRINAWVAQTVIEELTWFALRPQLKTAVLFEAQIVDDKVRISIGYQGFNVNVALATQISKFEGATTGLAFDVDARPLYLCWRLLRAYDSDLSVQVIENDAVYEPSELHVVFTLPMDTH